MLDLEEPWKVTARSGPYLKRFRYYYGDTGEIHFDNSPLGGAIVDIHIPYKTGGEEHETIARG